MDDDPTTLRSAAGGAPARRRRWALAVIAGPLTILASAIWGPTAQAASSGYSANLSPCQEGTATSGAVCDQEPQQIEVSYPPGLPPSQVTVSFSTTGRPAAAPDPKVTSQSLTPSDAADCGTNELCWPWPSALTDDTVILNGAYDIAICPFGEAFGSTCYGSAQSVSTGLAVPPGQPAAVTARQSSGAVGVTWSAPVPDPPDLVGYRVYRNSRAVYTCSTDGLGPGATTACPSSLTITDRPGPGSYTYTVAALRLGQAADGSDTVSSAQTDDDAGSVTVPDPAPTGSAPGGDSSPSAYSIPPASLPPIVSTDPAGPDPVSDSAGAVDPSSDQAPAPTLAAGDDPVDPAAVSGSSGSSGPSTPTPSLAYPPSGDLISGHPVSIATGPAGRPGKTDVGPAAVVALGLLTLAVAAHVLFLRARLPRYRRDIGFGPLAGKVNRYAPSSRR